MPPVSIIDGPGGRDQRAAMNTPPIDAMAPNKAARSVYLEMLMLIFFAAAAGIMTREPVNIVPATLIPIATIKETIIKKMKFILSTDIFIDFAKSLDSVLIVKPRRMREIIITIAATDSKVIRRSAMVTEDISPNNASSNSWSGTSKIPMAKLRVKNIPTNVSEGSSVFLSSAQTPKIAANNTVNAPKNGLKFHNNAKAMPGKAT